MLELLNNIILAVADPLLGWLLRLPPDVALIVVAVATSAILTFVRLFTTNQDLLRRVAADKKRLKQLIREARAGKDKDAVKRYRTTMGALSLKQMKAEGKPLLVSIVPIAILAVWAFGRLGFVPARAGDDVEFRAYFKQSAIDHVAVLVPRPGLAATNGWVQRVIDDPDSAGGTVVNGLAVWTLRADASDTPYTLEVRYGGKTYARSTLEVNGRTYAPTLEFYGEDDPVTCTQVNLRELKLFGVLPGLPWIGFPPWLVAYLVIAIPFVFLLKRLFHIR